ncbi:unnamed protein product [Prorocentrum cordatum]|uniref:RNA-dependent RNA polymerase n=1 Tax=Prorocentrum cordatum TaxID=2364126 RepID=A0ABN9RLH8_9DINO|nr:unnamed protein product [Polarella glacialis]
MKGMLGAAERLRGLRRLEVPHSMLKFEGFGETLGVIAFSTVRRAAIPRHLALLLECRGMAAKTLLDHSERHVEDILGPLTIRQAARVLGDSGDAEEQSNWYLATMAKLLGAGFSIAQHPLLESVRRQQEARLTRALRSVWAPGVWSCHGMPEPLPSPGEGHILKGRQVFCMVPAPERNELESPGWRALAGPVLLYEGTDREPSAIRLCEAIDAVPLRKKCHPGLLYFSAAGEAIQDGLSWDFDGDRFYLRMS